MFDIAASRSGNAEALVPRNDRNVVSEMEIENSMRI